MQKAVIILLILIAVVGAVFLFWPKAVNHNINQDINMEPTNSQTDVSAPRWLELSGSTKVGEGATWSLLIESDGGAEFIHQGNRGNGEIAKDVDSAKIDPAKIESVFDKIAVILEKYRGEVKSVASDGGEPSGLEVQNYYLSNFKKDEIHQESIQVGGFLLMVVTVEDSHPAFGEIKSILAASDFLTTEYSLLRLRK